MANGWKAAHPYYCAFMRGEYAFDTMRRQKWLTPAVKKVNGKGVLIDLDKMKELCEARIQPKAA